MNKYLKDNLILGDSLENFFGWITLPAVMTFLKIDNFQERYRQADYFLNKSG